MRKRATTRPGSGGPDREAVREDERRLLARALHDDVGQLLTAARLELDAVVRQIRNDPPSDCVTMMDRLQAAVGLVDLSARAIRELATTRRPPVLEQAGLAAAIRWETSVFGRRTGITCHVQTSDVNPTPAQGLALFGIVVEALRNTARHARAASVSVRLRESRRRLILQIRDDGRGISEDEALGTSSLGVRGMRDRAGALGGTVYLRRLRSGGTRLVVSIPIGAAAPEDVKPGA